MKLFGSYRHRCNEIDEERQTHVNLWNMLGNLRLLGRLLKNRIVGSEGICWGYDYILYKTHPSAFLVIENENFIDF